MSKVMALRHGLVSCLEESKASGKATTKRRPCRRSSVAWLQGRRRHPNFGRFQTVADADGKASLHTRTPFQWDTSANAGFTDGTPWLPVNRNYTRINLESQKLDPDSVYQYYRRLLALRKDPQYAETVVYGDLHPVFEDQDRVMAYYRTTAAQTLLVIGNFKTEPQNLTLPAKIQKVVLNNLSRLKAEGDQITLEGYQAVILDVSSDM